MMFLKSQSLMDSEAGYEYDVVNSDVIINRMSVQDGRIILPDGMILQGSCTSPAERGYAPFGIA